MVPGYSKRKEGGTQMTEGWEISIRNIDDFLNPYSVYKCFIEIILNFITHSVVRIIIPMFCGRWEMAENNPPPRGCGAGRGSNPRPSDALKKELILLDRAA